MHFFKSLIAGAAMVSLAIAQSTTLTFNSVPASVTAGVPVTILYGGNGGNPVSIILLKGPSINLQTIATLTTTSSSGSFVWTPDFSLPAGTDYALEITQGNVINYSAQFPLVNSGAAPSVPATIVSSVSATIVPSVSATLPPVVSSILSSALGVASSASSVANPAYSVASSIIASANPSVTPFANATTPAYVTGGTGTALPRNTTMSMATLTPTSGTGTGSITGGPRGGGAVSTAGSPSASEPSVVMSTGGAAVLTRSLALVLCAMVAMVYLN